MIMLDKVLADAKDKDLVLEIKIPKDATRREAMAKMHRQTAIFSEDRHVGSTEGVFGRAEGQSGQTDFCHHV